MIGLDLLSNCGTCCGENQAWMMAWSASFLPLLCEVKKHSRPDLHTQTGEKIISNSLVKHCMFDQLNMNVPTGISLVSTQTSVSCCCLRRIKATRLCDLKTINSFIPARGHELFPRCLSLTD